MTTLTFGDLKPGERFIFADDRIDDDQNGIYRKADAECYYSGGGNVRGCAPDYLVARFEENE